MSVARCASEAAMLTAIAVPYSTLPLGLIKEFGLAECVHERGGEPELQFH
jgi:hypothetical protein